MKRFIGFALLLATYLASGQGAFTFRDHAWLGQMLSAPPAGAESLTNALVGYWRMDATNAPLADVSGSGNNLTVAGSFRGVVSSLITNAVESGDGAIATNAIKLGEQDSFTFLTWVTPTATIIGQHTIAEQGDSSDTTLAAFGVQFRAVSGYFGGYVGEGGTNLVAVDSAADQGGPVAGATYMLCFVGNTTNRTLTFYYGGTNLFLVSTNLDEWTGVIATNNFPFAVFGGSSQPSSTWDYRMDDTAFWRRPLSSNEVWTIYDSGTSTNLGYSWVPYAAGGPNNSNLSNYWKFDETMPFTSGLADSVGAATVFTNSDNGTGFNSSAGVLGNCTTFTATHTCYAFTNTSIALGDSAWTVTGWVNFTTFETFGAIVSKAGGSNRELLIREESSDNKLHFYVSTTSDSWDKSVTNSATLSTGTWYFFAAVHDPSAGGSISLYVGNQSSMLSTNTSTGIGALYANTFGHIYFGDHFGSGNELNAKLDEIGIWKKAMTAAEVNAEWNGGSGITHP